MRWGVDVSLWQDEGGLTAAQVYALAAGGCSFAIIRAGQPWRADSQLVRHLTNFGNAQIPVGVYFWGDPTVNALEQIDWYLSICDPWRNQIGCYALDADQLAEHWHCCTQTARDRMRKVVERGQFAAVKVWDAERKMTITVWRRV